jgi:protein involved in polysaccharide export with SLBB domain
MAYTAGNLTLMSSGNGFCAYRYDTTDATDVVDAAGYFNNADDDLNLKVGDTIEVVVWGTAVRTGTIADYDMLVVNEVTAAGVVDTTNALHGITVADTR